MATYAKTTKVPVTRSRLEIEQVLRRYGARQFVSGWDDERGVALIGFSVLADDGNPRQVRMKLPIPEAAQLERQAWRCLLLVIKAKLEAVDSGISSIEREFMADVVMPNGRTLGEWAGPQLTKMYASGKMPKLLGA